MERLGEYLVSNLSDYVSRISLAVAGNTTGTVQTVGNGSFVLAGGPNVTLSQNGRTVTISANAGGGGGGIAASAGTQLLTSGTLSFADSNGITWGLNNGTITASYTVPVVPPETPFGVSAGTQSVSTGTLVFSNSNNVTFGMSGSSRITASASFPAETPFGVSAGTQSVSTGTLVFSNSNNVTFGMSGSSRVTASASFPAETPFGVSAGTQSVSTGTLVFSDSNGISFGMSGSSRITASYTVPTETPFGISAGTQSVSTGTLVFSNSNNVTFGMSGSSRVTASASFPAETPFGISAGTQSVSTGTMVFSDSNGISFGMSGSSRITASYTVPAQFTGGFSTGGNTLGDTGLVTGRMVLAGGPNITLSGSTNGASITVSISGGAGAAGNTGSISAGTTRATLGEVVFSNSNNVSFGVNGQTVTATVTVPAETPFGISAGTQSISTGTLVFSDSNGISFGMSGSSRITASYTVPTQTVQAGSFTITGNTAANSTGTIAAGLVVNASTNITAWMSNGSLVLSGPAAGAGAGFSAGVSTDGLTAGSTGVTGTRVVFVGTNGILLSQSTDANGATISAMPQLQYPRQFVPYIGTSGGVPHVNGQLVIAPLAMPFAFSFTNYKALFSISISSSSNSSHAGAFSFFAGLYSQSGGTWSLASSASQSYQWTNTSNNSIASLTGLRAVTVPLNVTGLPNNYALAWFGLTSSTNANWFTMNSVSARAIIAAAPAIGAATNASLGMGEGFGAYSATTSAFPASIAHSQMATQSVIRCPLAAFRN